VRKRRMRMEKKVRIQDSFHRFGDRLCIQGRDGTNCCCLSSSLRRKHERGSGRGRGRRQVEEEEE
jgi:hypothetical protein